MSNGNEDEIIDSTNHIMGAISSQEARLVRLEAQQNQLSHHVKRLTDQFVLGVKTQDTFYDMFAVSTYGGYLNKHVKDIRDGLLELLNNRLHPVLVTWSSLEKAIEDLRKRLKPGACNFY